MIYFQISKFNNQRQAPQKKARLLWAFAGEMAKHDDPHSYPNVCHA
jgi:hypothetical protein